MWEHNYDPLGSPVLSTLVAAVPIVVLLIMIGVLRKPAWMSALAGLGTALIVATVAYGMPADLAVSSALMGAAFGLLPIGWIVYWAVVLYRITLETGNFEVIKDSIGGLTTDRRLQAMLIAFAFGAFVEGAAGFGTPVAVAAAMLTGLGFSPFFAAGICLLANTAPVAFGSIGIPVVTLAGTTGIDELTLSQWVGRICAPVSVFIPAYLIMVMGGFRGLKGVLPAAIVCGVCFASVQFLVSNFIGPQLVDIMAALTAIIGLVVLLKVWQPKDNFVLAGEHAAVAAPKQHGFGRTLLAWSPYLLLVAFVLVWGYGPVEARARDDEHRVRMARAAQRDHAHGADGPAAGTVRGELHVQLARGGRLGLRARDDGLGARAARLGRHVRRHPRPRAEAARVLAADDRLRARPRVRHELQRRRRDARPRVRRDGRHVPVLQRARRLARRVPDRQRHVGERAVRQLAGRHGQQLGLRSRDHGGVELRRAASWAR